MHNCKLILWIDKTILNKVFSNKIHSIKKKKIHHDQLGMFQ